MYSHFQNPVPTSPAGHITGGNDEPRESYHEPWCTRGKLGIPASPASPASENGMFRLERIEGGSLEEERTIQARNEVDRTKQTISTTIRRSAYTSKASWSDCLPRFSAALQPHPRSATFRTFFTFQEDGSLPVLLRVIGDGEMLPSSHHRPPCGD